MFNTLAIQGIKPPAGEIPGICFKIITPCGGHDLTRQYVDLYDTWLFATQDRKVIESSRCNTYYNPVGGYAIARGDGQLTLSDMIDEVSWVLSAGSYEIVGYGV
jgi:hypothetical protein